MVIPGAKFLGNVAKYGTKATIVGDMLNTNINTTKLAVSEPLLNVGRSPGNTTLSNPTFSPNGRTSYVFFERGPAKISDLERRGVPKPDRIYEDPEVLENAKKFAQKYGYDEPTNLQEIKDMYRQHNTAFRSVQTDFDEDVLGKTVANMSTEDRAKFLASRGYPEILRSFQKDGAGKYSDDYVFVSPDIASNNSYVGDGMTQVMVRRPFV